MFGRIAQGQEGTRDEIKGLHDEIKGLRRDMEIGFSEVNARLDQTNARLDHMLIFTGKSHADLAKRVTALERKVFKKSG